MQVTGQRGGSIVRPQIIFNKSILRSCGLDLQLLHNIYSYHDILIRFHRIYEFFNWIERSVVSENEKGRITSLIVLISFWEANTPHLLVLYQMGFIAPARGKPHRHHPVSNPHIHTFQSAISSKMWGGVFMPGARVKNIQKKSCKEK